MKARLFDSIRMKLLVALLLSLLATILTDVVIFGGIYLVKHSVTEDSINKAAYEKKLEQLENELPENTDNSFGTNTAEEKNTINHTQEPNASKPADKNQYAPNEYVSENDRTYNVTLRIRHRGFLTPHIWVDCIIIIVLSAFLFLVYYVVFTNHIIMYFREIQLAIERIKNGDLDTTVSVRGSNELSELAESINEMKYALKQSMESERQAEQVKNELVTNVAHDLRTPLTSIIGYLELLHREEYNDAGTRQKYTDTAYQKAKTLQVLINELFDYTRFQKGKVKLELATLDITMFLEQMIDEFKLRMAEENLTCITDIPKEPIMIEGDGEKLARAFSNLLTNAVKYGADGKQIKVSLIELEDQVYVSFTNYGKVIPQENLPYIFDKFYRVEQSRNVKTGGTGLGLAIAKNVVLMHDGEISAKSDEKGTVFTVCLPKPEAKKGQTGTRTSDPEKKKHLVQSLFKNKKGRQNRED